MNARSLWYTVGALSLMLVIAVGWKLQPILFPSVAFSATQQADCDLNQSACQAIFADGSVIRLEIQPRPIPALQPLTIKLTVTGLEARSASLDIDGVEMNMGYFHYAFTPTEDKDHFHASGGLPVCTTKRMAWRAQIYLDSPNGGYRGVFYFDVVK